MACGQSSRHRPWYVGADLPKREGTLTSLFDKTLQRAMEIAALIARHPRQAVQTELDCLHRGTELSQVEANQYTHRQYWLSRQLMGDDSETGTRAIETMKNAKEDK